jgi:F-type H+-transporting ATPase subunit a
MTALALLSADSYWTSLLHDAGMNVPNSIVLATISFLLLTVLALVGGRSLSVERPGGLQQVLEVGVSSFVGLLEDTIPHHARRHLRILGTLAFFILVSNLLGLIPSFGAATSYASITLGLAITSFVYYNVVAVREIGAVKHVKHLFGPVLLLSPLIFVIELVSHFARNLSLSMRLFGNIFGEHSATEEFYGFAAYGLPIPMMFLGLFGAFLQTFIFSLLSMIYIALATEH